MKILFTLLLLVFSFSSYANTLTSSESDSLSSLPNDFYEYILPISLITYGVIGLESHFLRFYNYEIKEEVGEHIDNKMTVDDFSQYSAFFSVYLLNSLGIEGEHNLKDRTIILATAYALMGATVLTFKATADVTRPDGSSNNSFPSGHTATAFMGAEFLYQEYKDVSVLYGAAGYAVALGTGIFRMLNDRHWLTDVAAGAGFGILSTKISYYLFDRYFDSEEDISFSLNPIINKDEVWLSLKYNF